MTERPFDGELARSNRFVEVLRQTSLLYENFQILGGSGASLKVFDPARGDWRKGEFFVTLPEELVEVFPGSVVLASEFLQEIGVEEEKLDELTKGVEGKWDYGRHNEAALEAKSDDFSLTVYNGSIAEPFLKLSELAVKGFDDPQVRAEYQKEAFEVSQQLFSNETKGWKLRIIEDVIASGETIAGNLALALQQGILNSGDTVRIDVISATTQGLLLLKKFVEDNGLKLELHVGALAYGLSEGEPTESGARLHANYVVYPDKYLERVREIGLEGVVERLEGLKGDDGNIYVVGDMGDAFKSLPAEYDEECPWNRFRKDPHGPRGEGEGLLELGIEQDENLGEIHFYANGGYFMLAAYLAYELERGFRGVDRGTLKSILQFVSEKEKYRLLLPIIRILSAKMVWTDRRPRIELKESTVQPDIPSAYGVLIGATS